MEATDIRLMGLESPGNREAEALAAAVEEAGAGLDAAKTVPRIWAKDWTLWKDRDEEISNRLGWLDAVDQPAPASGEELLRDLRAEGIERAVVLGMGGSSLAPEVLAKALGRARDGLDLSVLDSTDPAALLDARAGRPAGRSFYLVSSKSGSTLETSSLLAFFHAEAVGAAGPEAAGRLFAAITDPGTSLARLAGRLGFRRIFEGDPDVGGRFSAFTPFGLVPAALLGIDIARLLGQGRMAARACREPDPRLNPGAKLGAILGAAARQGRDKLALLLPRRWESLGAWIEQLVAESTGKEGRGILPFTRRPEDEAGGAGSILDLPGVLPVFFETGEEDGWRETRERAAAAGRPGIVVGTGEACLGGQLFLWEFATAVAGRVLGINPFDQPDVASSKKRTMESLAEAVKEGRVAMGAPDASDAGETVWAGGPVRDAAQALGRLMGGAATAGYAVFQAFLPPRPDVREALRRLALRFQTRAGLPTAFDFGPRFLHSTGQLHKGDSGRGIFIQLTADHPADLPVPGPPGQGEAPAYTFGTLIDAQAAGDRRALLEKGRRVLAIRFHGDPVAGLARLAAAL
jgi:glucose-6-phosphate isomerase